jgi:hypothetical protein
MEPQMHDKIYAYLAMMALTFVPGSAFAQQGPVAIVEEVDSKGAGVEFMEYLTEGRTVHLAPKERLVIGYLKSCWRETITDGTVTIGAEQSETIGGNVERIKVRCDSKKKTLVTNQTVGSGAMVFRKMPGRPKVQVTIYGQSPVFEVGDASNLVIERLGQKERPIHVDMAEHQRMRGSFYDLAKSNISLAPGGIYRATVGGREVIFRVDKLAEPQSGGIVGRLVSVLPPG